MKKVIFMALATVFMLSSGFSSRLADSTPEIYDCQCACLVQYTTITGVTVTLRSYVRDAAYCSSSTNGYGQFDSEDCQRTGGMLNAGKNIESFQDAQSGGGC